MHDAEHDSIWRQIQQAGCLGDRPVHYFESVESTNTLALAMGQDGAATGTVLVAEGQAKGRGRLGKAWASPTGTGLYATVLLRPAIPLAQLARLTLAAGLAVARAIDEVGGVSSAIKWPNDVLIGDRKVAGVLAECSLTSGAPPLVALGVGINLTTRREQFPPEIGARATSLLEGCGKHIPKGLMLTALLRWLELMLSRLEQGDFTEILQEWRGRDATVGKRLAWLVSDGRTVHGVSLGPDQEGLLVIRDSDGQCHHVLSGDIRLDPNTLNGYLP